jgi:hypothetical protein
MNRESIRGPRLMRHTVLLALCACFLTACITDDYRQPVQQIQNASSVVISAARTMLNQVNSVEQDAAIDRAAFEGAPLDLVNVQNLQLVSQEEIDVRTKAFDELNSYLSSLASLASGKGTDAIATQTASLSTSLGTLAKNASALPVSKASFIKNADFGNELQLVATAFGTVAQFIAQHKALAALKKSIADTKTPIDNMISLLGAELAGAYARQKATLGAHEIYLTDSYKKEIAKKSPDQTKLMLLGDRIKNYLQQKNTLDSADPAPSVKSMGNAHDALVQYAQSNHDPKSLKDLVNAVQAFVNEAKPFGDALQSFISAK